MQYLLEKDLIVIVLVYVLLFITEIIVRYLFPAEKVRMDFLVLMVCLKD